MGAFMKCNICKNVFDATKREPKILPCSDLICLQCLTEHASQQKLSSFFLTCTLCGKIHTIGKLDDVPTSKTTVYLLKQNELTSKSEGDPSAGLEHTFQTVVEQLNKDMKLARFNIQLHYDDAINEVDIKTETLINSLNTARAQIQEKLNDHRAVSIAEFNRELERLNMINLSTVSNQKTATQLLFHLNRSEESLAAINRGLLYFSDNSVQPFNNSLLGHIVNKSRDTNFVKVKKLKSILSEENDKKLLTVSLKVRENPIENVIRQHVIPLSADRILKVYFTSQRSVYLELFDASGSMINKLNAYENLSSFPISYGYGKYFVLSFTSKSNKESFFESNSSYVLLYDTDMRLVKMLKKFSSVESVYMNEQYICLFYAHRSNATCSLFDYQLNELESFGQQTDSEKPFYMEKSQLTWRDQTNSALKNNPRIFGITKESIYLFNVSKMTIMDRATGLVKTQVGISGDMPYYLLDQQSNIIQVNSVSKRIAVINYEFDYSVHNVFTDTLEDVFLTADNNMAFVDKGKEKILFI